MSTRPSTAEFRDQSTMASNNISRVPTGIAVSSSRINSLDAENATIRVDEDLEKGKPAKGHREDGTVDVDEAESPNRVKAVNDAWPSPELESDPKLKKEAEEDEKDIFLVTFDEGEPLNPLNWSRAYRWYLTFASSLLILNASFASSAPSGMLRVIMEDFGMSQIEGTLTVSLFIAGYCIGPFVWAPTSESVGRRPMFIIGFFGYFAFQIACAVAPNTAALLIFRFLSGCFAACPLTNAGAVLGDIWDPETRGTATAIFTLAPFAGPAIGPIAGGYIAVSGTNWRWLFWVLTIFSGVCWLLTVFTMRETYGPVILVKKARDLRQSTGDQRYKAALELQEVSWRKKVSRILGRPWKIFFVESMLVLSTLYMSFVYGLLYLLFLAYPVVFVQGHHLNSGENGLTFIPIFLGGIIGVILYLYIFAPAYAKISAAHGGRAPPEARLPMAKWGGPILAISMFWFGWTSYPSISLWVPAMAGLGIGLAVVWTFLSLFSYIIDAYLPVAASALASSTVVRSAFGAGFPLFGNQMYTKLNPRIASTVLACIVILLIPVPYVFERVGPSLRKRSRYGVSN